MTHLRFLSIPASVLLVVSARADVIWKPLPHPVTVVPARILLQGPHSQARLLVDELTASGIARDASGRSAYYVKESRIAVVDAEGTVLPRSDGRTTITVRVGKRETTVPVEVWGVAKAGPPRFASDVVPVLTRAGCNQGSCHGSASGKGGFKLSLLGYDPDADYAAITRSGAIRRIVPTRPEQSLFLRKPTLAVIHKGGKRLSVDSPEYRLLADWIAWGAPAPSPDEPRVVRLEAFPSVRTLGPGQSQRFIVRAHLSDGTSRDVTNQTVFTGSDETVAKVSPDGEAKVTGPGEGAVLIRYRDRVATARVISPFGRPYSLTMDDGRSTIDRLVLGKLAALGLPSSPRSSGSDFIRRAYLDVIGLLPSADEARRFLADRDPKKREKLIDYLLERPEYIDFWAMKWSDLLRSTSRTLSPKGMYTFNRWIRDSVAENKPWDQFAREALLAQGKIYEVGPAGFYRTATKPEEMAETTAQAFLGVRIRCARCHNHPYERWTQNQYYQMAAFFARVNVRRDDGFVALARTGEVKHLRTGKEVAPCALDSTPIPATYQGDRREPLVEWITSPKNQFFARIIVNRIWRHFMGRGLFEPVDDLRVTNPPSNAPLLDWLAKDLVSDGYDVKHVMRSIMRSEAYQRSAEPVRGNERDARYYSHYPFKRLGAEQLMDALAQATGVPEKFAGFPAGTRAAQLPDAGIPSYFLDLFGRPARQLTCECERMDDPNLGQVIHLMNGSDINAKLSAKNGRIGSLIEAKAPIPRILEDLYLSSFSRYPNPDEQRKGYKALSTAKNLQQGSEDLLWALLNSKEFLFNH